MRTTLDIEADVLQAAKEIAAKEKTTAGVIISRLARKGLAPVPRRKARMRNGIPVLPPTGRPVTSRKVKELMDEEGI
jgi:hypothetical protein